MKELKSVWEKVKELKSVKENSEGTKKCKGK